MKYKEKVLFCLIVLIQFTSTVTWSQPLAEKASRPNILFIAVDDLRPELGAYGSEIAITPNMNKLAQDGLLFTRAYCQQAICGPSRASILTGLRPESSGVFHNYKKFREATPDVITLPQNFINNGYQTVSYGKVFHHGDKDPVSWSRPALKSSGNSILKHGFALPENQKIRDSTREAMFAKYGNVAKYGLAMGPAYEAAEVADNVYPDGENTDLAIQTLKNLVKEGGDPFFLALGFHKPHLNWVAPKKYWDLYSESEIEITSQSKAPEKGATMGLPPSFELRVRSGIPKKGAFSPELERKLKQAYLACVSYVDAQVGRMLDALEETGIKDNTIIILWSDHGWHLGDMGYWGKATNYEVSTRVPLIISTPDMPTKNKGTHTDALVELVDIYPTLSDLADIEFPEFVEGTSFAPLIEDPNIPWKKAAFSVFPTPALREWGAYPIRPVMRDTYFGPLLNEVEVEIIKQQKDNWDRDLFENHLMGYAMRTQRYRLIVWKDMDSDDPPIYYELYDHQNDPTESRNIAMDKPKVLRALLEQFNEGWKGNLPSSIP